MTSSLSVPVFVVCDCHYLISALLLFRAPQKLGGLMTYLAPLKDAKFDPTRATPAAPKTTAQVRDLGYLVNLFKHRALVAVYESGLRLAVSDKVFE